MQSAVNAIYFDNGNAIRYQVKDGRYVINELHNRGYALRIISNLISIQEIMDLLPEEGLQKYFQAVVLSSAFGKRKPSLEINQEAVELDGVDLVNSAYIGGKRHREVEGARLARFKSVVLLQNDQDPFNEADFNQNKPDFDSSQRMGFGECFLVGVRTPKNTLTQIIEKIADLVIHEFRELLNIMPEIWLYLLLRRGLWLTISI